MIKSAANVRAPFDRGSDNYDCRLYTVTTTARADAIPFDWCGRYVKARALGASVMFGFSKSSGAVVNYAATATNAGEASQVGDVLDAGQSDHFRVPDAKPGETVYLVRDGSGTGSLLLRLAEDPRSPRR